METIKALGFRVAGFEDEGSGFVYKPFTFVISDIKTCVYPLPPRERGLHTPMFAQTRCG